MSADGTGAVDGAGSAAGARSTDGAGSPDGTAPARADGSGAGRAGDHLRIVLRPIASSAPLGFYAFGTGTVLYSALQLQWVQQNQGRTIALLLLAFVGPLEIVAGLIGYLARDAGVATAMLIFGCSWVGLGLELLHSPPGSRSASVGIFLLMISAVVLTVGTAAVAARPLLAVLALLAMARYALSGAFEITGGPNLEHASGWLGMPIVGISLYGGMAFLLEEAMRRQILPVGRRRGAAAALEGDLGRQIEPLTREAGVRHLL